MRRYSTPDPTRPAIARKPTPPGRDTPKRGRTQSTSPLGASASLSPLRPNLTSLLPRIKSRLQRSSPFCCLPAGLCILVLSGAPAVVTAPRRSSSAASSLGGLVDDLPVGDGLVGGAESQQRLEGGVRLPRRLWRKTAERRLMVAGYTVGRRFRVVAIVYTERRGRLGLVRTSFGEQRIALDRTLGPSARAVAASGYFSMSRAAEVQASVTSRMNFA